MKINENQRLFESSLIQMSDGLRWYCDGTATVLRRYCDGAATVLRWYYDGNATAAPLPPEYMKINENQ